MFLRSTVLLICMAFTLSIALVKLDICKSYVNLSQSCDQFTFYRICQLYQLKLQNKCIQLVVDPQQSALIHQCFLPFLGGISSSVLVRTADHILQQNIFEFDDNSGVNTAGIYRHCRTITVLSDDPSVWLQWLDNAIRPVTMSRKRFHPFSNVFIVSQTKPVLFNFHWDYVHVNLVQLYWIDADLKSVERETEFLILSKVVHLPTNGELQLEQNHVILNEGHLKCGENEWNTHLFTFLQAGQSHRWQSFQYTHEFRASQTVCVPYVIPIYNKNGSIIR